MEFLQAVVLGIVQGATEFLPVSSSAHLAVIEHLWHLPEVTRVGLAAALHAGTGMALIVFFARRIGNILAGAVAPEAGRRRASWHYIGMIVLATIPAGLVGLLLEELIDRVFVMPAAIGVLLLFTGAVLFATRFRRDGTRMMGWRMAAAIGLAQAAAILPGVSRSGATISMGLLLGLRRELAFEFSFIMSIPVVLAAAVRELVRLDPALLSPLPVALGIAVAGLTGFGALLVLRRVVLGRRLWIFALYCWLAGLAVLAFVR